MCSDDSKYYYNTEIYVENSKIFKNIKMVESMLLGRITLGNTDWVDFFFLLLFFKEGVNPNTK